MNVTTTHRPFAPRLVAGLVACFLAASLAGCAGSFFGSSQPAPGPTPTPPPPPVVQPEPTPPPKPAFANSIAMLLPLGGPFREFGGRVQKGVKAAQDQLEKAGTPLDVHVIDATQPGWLDAVRNLPPEVTVVGGPMHRLTLKELETAGMLPTRVFVAFMPSLNEAREGVDAWRFFPSAEDEIDALLRLANGDYGINQFAVLRPGDRYGQTMGDAFALAASKIGAQITATGVYNPQDPASWETAVADMLHTSGSRPGFGAVFLPDEWARADKVLPSFFKNRVEDLLILGPQLWTEALYRAAATKAQINIQNYRLAVCPGAWWPENQGQATQQLVAAMRAQGVEHPDMWEAVGFDFARMAARLGRLPQGLPPQDVSARLAQAATGMDFSMAPLSYGPDGKAHVSMYLFRPSVTGPVLLDPEGFRQRLNAIRQKALENPAPENEQSYSPAQPAPGQAPAAPGQPGVPAQPGQPVPAQPVPAAPVPAHRQAISISQPQG
ncbi:MAG TPA: penicillin-binding protein activator [Solidesulfovibrio magneticus]|nr:penicillin-binding protein activator [Solidesulfovibrio magneticus]